VKKRKVDGPERRTFVLIKKKMVDARGVEAGGATNDAMHFVAFFKQQLGPGKNKECSIDEASHTRYVQSLTDKIHPDR
jgi:hypothetical protein